VVEVGGKGLNETLEVSNFNLFMLKMRKLRYKEGRDLHVKKKCWYKKKV
jgi:hypothetical protein